MDYIDAPYNFVPLADRVVIPKTEQQVPWGQLVSHDLPLRDGLSGELILNVKALSPLLVGGKQQPASEHAPGQVHFFQTPDQRYAIPGSSLRGMIRNVLEIATFSRMGRIDDKRYGLRDISGRFVAQSYADRVRNNVQFGFMQLNADGKPAITPCSMLRLDHRDLERWWGVSAPVFKAGSAVGQKYQLWADLCRERAVADPYVVPFDADSEKVTGIGGGGLNGFPVFTGQINAERPNDRRFGQKYKGRPKHKDFVFHSPRSAEAFELDAVDAAAWRNFLFIHGDEKGKPNMPWPGFWKKRFWNKQQVPVFYLRSQDRLSIGLAYMPKLAGDFSTHDLLQHSSEQHVKDDGADFAELLFGKVGEKPEDALKGRVFFEPAFLESAPGVDERPPATILNGAKPSYFPNYLYQQSDADGSRLRDAQYATYVHSAGNPAPELRGWKRYPARGPSEVRPQRLEGMQLKNKKVQTCLHTLQAGAEFNGRLVFHNLRPEELGALLWSLRFEQQRHGLGMGKSFGYGQITVQPEWQPDKIQFNDPDPAKKVPETPEVYIESFKDFMEKAVGTKEGWAESTQIRALLAMADPAQRDLFPGRLQHMRMGMKTKENDFLQAKQQQPRPLVLAPYVEDRRTLKKKSHVTIAAVTGVAQRAADAKYGEVSELSDVQWEQATLHFDPGSQVLTATSAAGEGTAVVRGEAVRALMTDLSKGEIKKAKKGLLQKTVVVEGTGNAIRIKSLS